MGCYYRPLQTLLLRHTPALIALPSLAKSPRLLCKASAIFGHLNLYSSAWMSHAAASLQKWLHAPHLASSF